MHRDDLLAKFLPLVGQAHADRAAVMERALLHDVARLDHLLHVVGDVRAKIAAAQGQLADRHLEIADVEQNHCLHVVDVMDAWLSSSSFTTSRNWRCKRSTSAITSR